MTINGKKTAYYQVSATTLGNDVLSGPLRKVRDNYPKYLLTLDEIFGTWDYDGIKKINVLEWLMT